MKTILAPRASAILYDVLTNCAPRLPFLLPANICPVVPLTFAKAGIAFEFVDISARSLSLDVEAAARILEARKGRIGGLLYAHTLGDPETPTEFFRWIKDRGESILLVDDRCLCMPDLEAPGHSPADVILYSTGYAKVADVGFGGYAFIRETLAVEHRQLPYDEDAWRLQEAAYRTAVSNKRPFVHHESDWLETDRALPAWPEYVDRVRRTLTETLEQRRLLNEVYNSIIPQELRLPERFQLWRYNLRLARPGAALKAIFDAGLFASSHYQSLVGIMGDGEAFHAGKLGSEILNLFNDHHYTVDMAERTAHIILRSH